MTSVSGATRDERCCCTLRNKGQRRTHNFIELIHLRKYWQLFSSLEYFVILIGMWQASERVFLAILQPRQEYDVKSKNTRTMAP